METGLSSQQGRNGMMQHRFDGRLKQRITDNLARFELDPGCTDAGIEACVCEIDDLCCTNAWDDVCVGEVVSAGCAAAC